MSVAGARRKSSASSATSRRRRQLLGSLLSAGLAMADLAAMAGTTATTGGGGGGLSQPGSMDLPQQRIPSSLSERQNMQQLSGQASATDASIMDALRADSVSRPNFYTSPQSLQSFQHKPQPQQQPDLDFQQEDLEQKNNGNLNLNLNLNYQEQQKHATRIARRGSTNQAEQSFSDWWHEFWSSKPFPSGYTQSSITLLACFIGTIILLIVVGNLLVCIAIFTEKSLKPTQNWFIASLAVSDMLLGLVVMPFSLARELMGFWMFGPLWCDIHEAIDVLLTTASINTLCLISLDRYWSITQAVKYLKKRTPRRGAFMIAFVWFFSAAVSLPPLFGWKKHSPTIIMETTKPAKMIHNSTSSRSKQPGDQDQVEPSGQRAAAARTKRFYPNRNPNPSRRYQQDQELSTPLLTISQMNQLNRANFNNLISSGSSSSSSSDYSDPSNMNDNADDLSYDLTTATTTTTTQATTLADQQQQSDITEYPSCQLSDDVGYVVYSALGSFYLPCAVMVFTYIKIFLAARSRARRTIVAKPSRNKDPSGGGHRRHMTATGPGGGGGPANTGGGPGAGAVHALGPRPSSGSATNSGRMLVEASSAVSLGAACLAQPAKSPLSPSFGPQQMPPALMKGKIVIVERKKSIAASSLAPLNPMSDDDEPPSANIDDKSRGQALTTTNSSCTLTTSGAVPALATVKQANASIYESSESAKAGANAKSNENNDNDFQPAGTGNNLQSDSTSSIVTVMKPSMAQVPVTRFNFQANDVELLASQHRAEEEKRNANALLNAITAISRECKLSHDGEPLIGDLLISKPASVEVEVEEDEDRPIKESNGPNTIDNCNSSSNFGPSTKETCFMTMDEDSEMIDEQAGRTILMVASNSKQAANEVGMNGVASMTMMTMMPPGGQSHKQSAAATTTLQQCPNLACRRRAASALNHCRSGSSYCGSDVSINECEHEDGDDDLEGGPIDDDEDEDDDGLISEDAECNGFSVSCGLEEGDSCSRCHECDADSNDNSYSNCPRNVSSSVASDSPCAIKPRQHSHNLPPTNYSRQVSYQLHNHDNNNNNNNKIGNATTNAVDVDLEAFKHHMNSAASCRKQHRHHKLINAAASDEDDDEDEEEDLDELGRDEDDDGQSYEDDDEEDEEEENSSVLGHDMLDATPGRKSNAGKRKSLTNPNLNQQLQPKNQRQMTSSASPTVISNNPAANRKRSIIGIRLPSLGGGGGAMGAHKQQPQDHHPKQEHERKGDFQVVQTEVNGFNESSTQKSRSSLSNNDSKLEFASGKNNNNQQDRSDSAKATSTTATYTTTTAQSSSSIGVGFASSNSGGTRNLKALRQNFFLKLNQLTAKSSKNNPDGHQKNHKLLSASSSDKPSLSYEPSTSIAMDYPGETTIVDDYDQQTSGENQNSGNTIDLEQASNCQPGNSSDQTGDDDTNVQSTSNVAHFGAPVNGKSNNVIGTLKPTSAARHSKSNHDHARQANKRIGGTGATKSMIVTSSSGEKSGLTFDDQSESFQQNHHAQFNGNKKMVKIEGSQISSRSGGTVANSTNNMSTGPPTKRAHLPSDTERHKRKLAKARERRATLILGLIMAAFITSWMPFFTFYVLRALCTVCRDYISSRLEAFIFWMGYCNSAINPIIYTIFNRDFRKAFRKILFRCL